MEESLWYSNNSPANRSVALWKGSRWADGTTQPPSCSSPAVPGAEAQQIACQGVWHKGPWGMRAVTILGAEGITVYKKSEWRMKYDGCMFCMSMKRQRNAVSWTRALQAARSEQVDTVLKESRLKEWLLWIESRLKDWKWRIRLGRKEVSSSCTKDQLFSTSLLVTQRSERMENLPSRLQKIGSFRYSDAVLTARNSGRIS